MLLLGGFPKVPDVILNEKTLASPLKKIRVHDEDMYLVPLRETLPGDARLRERLEASRRILDPLRNDHSTAFDFNGLHNGLHEKKAASADFY